MARPPRIEFPGAFYHVVVRGNQQQKVFGSDPDRLTYLDILARNKEKHGFVLYAYVLMSNHIHLLVETGDTGISRVMQSINQTYTQYFNRKYRKVGHLFQGRFKGILCDRDAYLVHLVRYIHLNPVRAKLVSRPEQYRWSSHGEYLGERKGVAAPSEVLRMFSGKVAVARRRYREFVDAEIGGAREEMLYQLKGQQVLGDDRFVEETETRWAKRVEAPLVKPPLTRILQVVTQVTGVSKDEMAARTRLGPSVLARGVWVRACREFEYRLVDLRAVIKRDLPTLSRWGASARTREGDLLLKKVIKSVIALKKA